MTRWFSKEVRQQWNIRLFGTPKFTKVEFVYSMYWLSAITALGYWMFWVRPEREKRQQGGSDDDEQE